MYQRDGVNMKQSGIKRLLEENEKLHKKRSNVESRLVTIESSLNQSEQYGRSNTAIYHFLMKNS